MARFARLLTAAALVAAGALTAAPAPAAAGTDSICNSQTISHPGYSTSTSITIDNSSQPSKAIPRNAYSSNYRFSHIYKASGRRLRMADSVGHVKSWSDTTLVGYVAVPSWALLCGQHNGLRAYTY